MTKPTMRIFNRDLRLQDVTLVYFTALAALMVILVASYQAPMHAVDLSQSVPSGPAPPLPMPFRVPLDPRGELYLAWNISYANQEISMELRVADLKQGVLLGMSDRGELTNADLVVLWNTGTRSYFGVRRVSTVSTSLRGDGLFVWGRGLFCDCTMINEVIKPLIKNHSNCTNGSSSSGNHYQILAYKNSIHRLIKMCRIILL